MSASPMPEQQAAFVRIHALYQLALPLLHADGEWEEIEGYPGRVRSYERDDLMMLHRTPFQPVPVSKEAQKAGVTAMTQREAARAYGLDVWWQRRKVMSLIWNDGGPLGLITYKEGPWETALQQLAAA